MNFRASLIVFFFVCQGSAYAQIVCFRSAQPGNTKTMAATKEQPGALPHLMTQAGRTEWANLVWLMAMNQLY